MGTARETCSRPGVCRSNRAGEAPGGEDVGCSASEPDSASLRESGSGQPSEGGEASTIDEVTSMSSRWAPRGG